MMTSPQMTQKGFALLAKVQSRGITLKFTDMCLGDGIWNESEVASAVTLASEKMRVPVGSIKNDSLNNTYLSAVFSNEGLSAGFYVREIGVLALDPDDGEILYEYCYTTDLDVNYFDSDFGSAIIQETVDIVTNFENVKDVMLTVDGGAVFVTREEFLINNQVLLSQVQKVSDADIDDICDGTAAPDDNEGDSLAPPVTDEPYDSITYDKITSEDIDLILSE